MPDAFVPPSSRSSTTAGPVLRRFAEIAPAPAVPARWLARLLARLLGAAALVAGLALGAAPPAHAQGTTASLTGTVLDENGDPLPGVNVVAIHEPTGTRYGAATGRNGRYTLLNVRVGGPYTVRASFVGFQTVEETGLRLALDEKQVVDFQLTPKTQELEEVQVIGRQAAQGIDDTQTGAATNVNEEQIDRLPTISRTISDFTRLAPQASSDGSIGGRNRRYNSIQIDGATIDDVFGLSNTPGGQAGAEPISLDAIKEFNINIAPFDVRKSGFTGGQINAVTKSGTNEYEGLVRYRYGSEGTTGDFDGVGTNDFLQRYLVANLGGPIIEDELFFFVNAEVRRQSSPEAVQIGSGSGPNTFTIEDSALDRIGESTTQAALNRIRAIADSVYGFDTGGTSPVDQNENNEKLFAKIDWNVSSNHRLTLRHNYVNARDDQGLGRGSSFYDFGSQQYQFESVQNSSVAQLNSTFGDNVFNEARLVYTRIRDERKPPAPFPSVELDLGQETVEMGVGRFNQANRLAQDLVEFTNDLTVVVGDHTLTGGVQFNAFDFSNLFIQDYYGSYTFSSFTGADGETVSAVEAFRRGQPTEYRYSYATDRADSDRPVAAFTAYQGAAYLQDEWQPVDGLRLTGGVRVDVPVIPQTPTFNPTAQEELGVNTSRVASGNLLVSPRFGFNYGTALLGDELETRFRGGAGLFAGRPPFVFISNQYSNTGADLFRIDTGFSPGEDFGPNERFMPTSSAERPADQPKPGGDNALSPVETTEINVISDDFKYPQTFRTNLGIDQELPLGLTATLEGLFSQSVNEVVYEDLNIRQTGASRYGRPLYEDKVSDRFTNALLLKNASTGFEYSITGQVERRAREGLTGQIAYTYTHAENVNNATSDRAISNWQFNETKDINDPRLGTADFVVEHRILGELNYRVRFADRFATTVGLIYEGRSGEPFSWVYNGNANFDTEDTNDLVYVPASESEVVLTSENWDLLDSFIEGEEALDDARGSVIRRNTARAPWGNILDLRLTQDVETLRGQRVRFIVDVKNVLNLVGGWVGQDDWGRLFDTSFNSAEAWEFSGYVEEEDVGTQQGGRVLTTDDLGKPIISFNESTVQDVLTGDLYNTENIGSRWRLRLGVKYTF
jgi:hypothetical protein